MRDEVILAVRVEKPYNPIFIDINDFQFLMPPVCIYPPYEEIDFSRIKNNIGNGKVQESKRVSGLIQGCIPEIKRYDIVDIYEIFEI